MTTARNYLADQGLAIRGARGKFSKEAKAALAQAIANGQTFDDWNENGRIVAVHVPRTKIAAKVSPTIIAKPVTQAAPTNRYNAIRIVDEYGISMTIGHCSACANSVSRCACSGQKSQAPLFLTKNAQSVTLVRQ